MLEIYADGAYEPILGRGGWGAVVLEDSQKRVFSGTAKKTTSNRMEITAALEGISQTPKGAQVVVYTDSQYVVLTMTRGWRRRANLDLWQRLDEAISQRKVQWEWVSSEAEKPFQKEAHDLANAAAEVKTPQQVPSPKQKAQLEVHMVDISDKSVTEREAVARGMVKMQPSTLELIKQNKIAKGNVLALAQTAGIMGAKQTPHLIPLCHPLLLNDVKVEFLVDDKSSAVEITATVKCSGKTGVEMEALTAVATSALTIYDMCKAVDPSMRIENIRLVRKSGGKSGTVVLE